MKYFRKHEMPTLFAKWKIDNAEQLKLLCDDNGKKANDVWNNLGRSLSNEPDEDAKKKQEAIILALEESLMQEQGYICCYCGCRLSSSNVIKEHFWDKDNNRPTIFDYNNLFASCEGGKLTAYSKNQEVKMNDGTILKVNNFEDIVKILCDKGQTIDVETIENYPKNKYLKGKEIGKGDKIYFPNPPHCDTAKSNKICTIINPSTQKECEFDFIYTDTNDTCVVKGKTELAEKTIDVLQLNADTLVKNRNRRDAYYTGTRFSNDFQESFQDLDIETLTNEIVRIIEDEIYLKKDGKLPEFCAVSASTFKNSFL